MSHMRTLMRMTHPLAEYMNERGLTQADIAATAKVSQSMVSHFLRGESRLGVDPARRIYEASKGRVPLKALLYWPDVPLPELKEHPATPRRTAPRRSPVHTQRETSTR